jgi:basic endochitinase B
MRARTDLFSSVLIVSLGFLAGACGPKPGPGTASGGAGQQGSGSAGTGSPQGGGGTSNPQAGNGGGAGATGSGTAGSTGQGTAGAGAAGKVGTTGAAGGTAQVMCPAGMNRCDCQTTKGDGINIVIDDFENNTLLIPEIDSRAGQWFGVGAATASKFGVEATSGGAPESTKALHMTGPASLPTWATYGVPLGLCYDASAFSGISFWMKGDPTAGNKSVKFSIATPPTTEKSAGGTCPNLDAGCYNSFADQDYITLTPTWTQYSFTWAQLKQADWGPTGKNGLAPTGYMPQKQILNVDFAPIDNTKGYDFWVDDVRLAATTPGSCADVVSQQMFEGFFPARNAFYTYAGFAAAAKLWPRFCGEGSADIKKQEAAAFFAHLVQESGSLRYLEEIGCENGSCAAKYCDNTRTDFPCAAGQSYHGRGPMQLSWNYNYGSAGKALGLSFLAQPASVLASPTNAFNAGLWFWMTRQPIDSAHNTIVSGQGFGATIKIVNGPLECGGKNPTAVQNRVNAYLDFTTRLGVAPGPNTGC